MMSDRIERRKRVVLAFDSSRAPMRDADFADLVRCIVDYVEL